jgi:hypothetical protein
MEMESSNSTYRFRNCRRATRTLPGFKRIHFASGATQHVAFTLEPRDLSQVNKRGDRVVSSGEYRVSVGRGQPGTAPGRRGHVCDSGRADIATRMNIWDSRYLLVNLPVESKLRRDYRDRSERQPKNPIKGVSIAKKGITNRPFIVGPPGILRLQSFRGSL